MARGAADPRALTFAAAATMAGSTAAAPSPAARQAAVRLLAPLPVADSLRGPLLDGVTRVFVREDVRAEAPKPTYTVGGCEGTPVRARLVDLNGDATPELEVVAEGSCVAGRWGEAQWLFGRAPNARTWARLLDATGSFGPLRTRTRGYTDLVSVGPGFAQGVWRWDGRKYDFYCLAGEPGWDTGQRRCPSTLSTDMSGDELPAFRDTRQARAPR